MGQAAAAQRWGVCSWCGWRDCALVQEGPPELWACDEHWPDGATRPSAAAMGGAAGSPVPASAPPALDRGAVRMYWERPEDDSAPTVAELHAARALAALERQRLADDALRAQGEQAAVELAAHRAVEAARAGRRWVPLGVVLSRRRRS